jgi:cyanophycinase
MVIPSDQGMVRILLLAMVVVSCCCGRVFLIGGALSPNNTDVYNALAKTVPGRTPTPGNCSEDWAVTTCPRIAVVTSAAANSADGDEAYSVDMTGSPSYHTQFLQFGMAPLHVTAHVDNYLQATDQGTTEGKRNYEILMQADIIFFNGGDQSRHSRTWLLDDGGCNAIFCSLISRYRISQVVWSGTSAGNAIMSNPTFGEGIPYGHIYFSNSVGLAPKKVNDGAVNGSGLSDTRNGTKGLQYTDNGGFISGFPAISSIYESDSHFDARGRLVRIVPDMKQLNKTYAFGVDEDTALFLDNNEGRVYGTNGVFFVDVSNATFPKTEYFTAKGVRVSYMSQGDRFSLNGNVITSSKPEITTPYYTNYTDSADIAAAYECTKLLTRLVDQKAQTNYGRTKVPSGYPSNAPRFELAFTKDSQTKGYYLNKKYTAVQAIINIGVLPARSLVGLHKRA